MRLFAFVLAALAVVSGVFAVDVQKSVIVSYSSTTPDSVLDQAKQAIEEGGGVILHEYKLIRGFAAKMGEKLLDSITTWGKDHNVVIEEDQSVTAL